MRFLQLCRLAWAKTRSPSLAWSLANFLGFQATWWACAVGAASGFPLVGLMMAFLWLSLHLATLRRAGGGERMLELRLILAGALVGYVFDSTLALAGLMGFPPNAGPALPTTPWMVALWAAFAATIRHSFNWARRRYVVGLLAGAILAPLAYRAGEALGALTLAPAPLGWLAVAAVWSLATPFLLWLRERIEGIQ